MIPKNDWDRFLNRASLLKERLIKEFHIRNPKLKVNIQVRVTKTYTDPRTFGYINVETKKEKESGVKIIRTMSDSFFTPPAPDKLMHLERFILEELNIP